LQTKLLHVNLVQIMDSLTQIILGAACGELALGKKIGNKALLFGAIGGTIPDLDVPIGRYLFSNEIDINAFHRGVMHSIPFAIIGAFIFGWLVFRLYDKGIRKNTTTLKDWIGLFFLSIFTHPLLDCFTPYGTQLFAPFSDYRVALNTISVVDPIYTLPFLISLITLMFYKRNTTKRLKWFRIGLFSSSIYLLITIFIKIHVNSVFKTSIKNKGYSYSRFQTQPSIFNTILWYGVTEDEDYYYAGFYSIFDRETSFKNWHRLSKNHELLPIEDTDMQTMSWFSSGYYNLERIEGSQDITYTDLRYPFFDADNPDSGIFKLTIYKNGDRLDMKRFQGKKPTKAMFLKFWERLKGI